MLNCIKKEKNYAKAASTLYYCCLGEQPVHQDMLLATMDRGRGTPPLHVVPLWVPHTTCYLGNNL